MFTVFRVSLLGSLLLGVFARPGGEPPSPQLRGSSSKSESGSSVAATKNTPEVQGWNLLVEYKTESTGSARHVRDTAERKRIKGERGHAADAGYRAFLEDLETLPVAMRANVVKTRNMKFLGIAVVTCSSAASRSEILGYIESEQSQWKTVDKIAADVALEKAADPLGDNVHDNSSSDADADNRRRLSFNPNFYPWLRRWEQSHISGLDFDLTHTDINMQGPIFSPHGLNAVGALNMYYNEWNQAVSDENTVPPEEREPVVVALVDTGVAYDHPDLADSMWENPAEKDGLPGVDDDGNGYVDDVHGISLYNWDNRTGDPYERDFWYCNGRPEDCHYGSEHGTAMSSVLGASVTDGRGTMSLGGFAGVKVMGIAWSTTNADITRIADGLEYALENDARISSHSYGWDLHRSADVTPQLVALLRAAFERTGELGHLVVTAAGNDAKLINDGPGDLRDIPCQFRLDNVICVGGVTADGTKLPVSDFGTSIDVGSPSGQFMALPYDVSDPDHQSPRWQAFNGTSPATAEVSGLAAFLWSFRPNLEMSQVKDALLQTVVPLTGLSQNLIRGRVDATKAMEYVANLEGAADPTTRSIWTLGQAGTVTVVEDPARETLHVQQEETQQPVETPAEHEDEELHDDAQAEDGDHKFTLFSSNAVSNLNMVAKVLFFYAGLAAAGVYA